MTEKKYSRLFSLFSKEKRLRRNKLSIPRVPSEEMYINYYRSHNVTGLEVAKVSRPEGEFSIHAQKDNKKGFHGRDGVVPANILQQTEAVDFFIRHPMGRTLALIQGVLHETSERRTYYTSNLDNFTRYLQPHMGGLVQETALVLLNTRVLDAWVSLPQDYLTDDAKAMYQNLGKNPSIKVSVNTRDQYVVTRVNDNTQNL